MKGIKEWRGSFQRLRKRMLDEREREVSTLKKVQSYRNNFFDWYFWCASNFGEELFYITFLPFTSWALGCRECAHFVILMLFFSVGLGNWLKNIFLIPRPPFPRVWTPENVQKTDHGFPSTHTISFVTAPGYLLIYQFYDKEYLVNEYPISLPLATVLTSLVAISVIFSRLYNGYHSPQDIAGGFLIGTSILTFFYVYWRHWLDIFLGWNSTYAPIVSFCICLSMILFHPRPPSPTAALPESGMVFGASCGTLIGVQMCNIINVPKYLGPPPKEALLFFIKEELLGLQVIRFLLGMIAVAIVRHFCKKSFTMVLKKVYPNEKDSNWVLTLVKFFNYTAVSFAITFWIQIIFYRLGIHSDWDLAAPTLFPTGYPHDV